MVSKKTLGDLGWEVVDDNGFNVFFRKGEEELCVDRRTKQVVFWIEESIVSFAEIAAILDFIVEDAIY